VAWADLETSQWSIYEGKCTSDNNDLLHIPDLILKLYAFYTFFYWSYFPYDGPNGTWPVLARAMEKNKEFVDICTMSNIRW
jgi:hypothetical protein